MAEAPRFDPGAWDVCTPGWPLFWPAGTPPTPPLVAAACCCCCCCCCFCCICCCSCACCFLSCDCCCSAMRNCWVLISSGSLGGVLFAFSCLNRCTLSVNKEDPLTMRQGDAYHRQTYIVHILDLLLSQVSWEAGTWEVPRGRRRLYGSHDSGSERVGLKGLR